MTTQEMHIGIDLYLQKVNSDYVDSLRPEEKDWFLNDEQKRFIFNRINAASNDKRQGLQYNQKRFDDIRDLITHYSAVAFIKDDKSNYINLPSNYLYLLNDRSNVNAVCSKFMDIPPASTKYYKTVFNLNHIDIVDINKLLIYSNGTLIFDAQDYNLNITDSSELFIIYNLILDKLKQLKPSYWENEVYWENFEDTYATNSFIIFGIDSATIEVTYDDKGADSITFNEAGVEKSYIVYNSIEEVPNRLTKTEDLYELLRGSFSKPRRESPISTLEGNQLVVFHKGYFILTEILISYFRIPRNVSLSLSINSELNPNVHEELVTQTAKRIAAYIETKNYNEIVNEDRIKE